MEKRRKNFKQLIYKTIFVICFISLLSALIYLNAKEHAKEEKELQRKEKAPKIDVYSEWWQEQNEKKFEIQENKF